ncbi:MAG: Alkaline serine exoprotease A precursor [Ignavibacteriae bacterium]|nr:MAG: Alkaline serine exoprotease A precursor [Ignavibacteriota bacterium]
MKNFVRFFSLVALVITLVFVGCQDQQTYSPQEPVVNQNVSPLQFFKASPATRIPDHYIVVFKEDVTKVADNANLMASQIGGKLKYVYQHTIKGFAVQVPEQAVKGLLNNPNVAYIEEDQVVNISVTQTNATWGIDRVDQRDLPLSTTYTYDYTGEGVDVYVIDTGIRLDHTEFEGRAYTGIDIITSGGTATDGNGHGTHVAGTIGGKTYGIAKKVRLYAVRVLDNSGSGTISGIISGVDWVTSHHTTNPAVANMSLGGSASTSLDDAVRRSIADGITYVVAAGNSYANAANYSPARVTEAITVGSTTSTDAFSSFSNYGSVVDILAPGSNITSAWYTSTTATNTISGTSMASPHVAGAAALYLQANPTASPATVQSAIINNATLNKITSVPSGTPNRLLYTLFSSTPTPPAAPTLSSPANGATGVSTSPTLVWNASSGATSYRLQVSTSSSFSTLTFDQSGITATSQAISGLANSTTYYWRVNASNSAGTSAWSSVWSFTTAASSQTCTGTKYTGTLSGTGASQIQPNGTYYYSSVSGTHKGCLIGPSNADFDLYLQKWNGLTWANVASSTSSTSYENISYTGTSGYYRWRIYSYSGSGSYEFYLIKP